MTDQIHSRLKELQLEYKKGEEKLLSLEQETATIRNTLLRISGAIQVLEELLPDKREPVPVNGVLESDVVE